jgi:hypothetical protein
VNPTATTQDIPEITRTANPHSPAARKELAIGEFREVDHLLPCVVALALVWMYQTLPDAGGTSVCLTSPQRPVDPICSRSAQ